MAADVVNTSSDVHQLVPVLEAVKANTEADPKQVLADAGYRSEEEMAELAKAKPQTELVIALGREGRLQAKPIDAERYPHTVASINSLREVMLIRPCFITSCPRQPI